jgi:hypothetical protein
VASIAVGTFEVKATGEPDCQADSFKTQDANSGALAVTAGDQQLPSRMSRASKEGSIGSTSYF